MDNGVVAQVQAADANDVEAAYQAARAAFNSGPWRSMKSHERAGCIYRLADLVDQNAAELAAAETAAMGVPSTHGNIVVRECAVPIWKYYAGWADKISGETFQPDGDGLYKIVQYEPLGVVAAISAWNGVPISLAWKIGAAVAAGNTVIHKSSEKSPLGTLLLGRLIVEAGFPPGVINLINGGGDVGAMLASHMKIAKIAFTGSTTTGRKVQEAAAKSNLKRVSLELGGKSPSIVFDDADLENALMHSCQGFLANSGQACTAASRLFVQERVAEKFLADLKARFAQAASSLGDPTDPQTLLGPVAGQAQFDRIMSLIKSGKEVGCNVAVGGVQRGDRGFYITPTLVLDPDIDNPLYTDEIFGPVLVVKTFKTEDEVLELANDTTYGLAGEVQPQSVEQRAPPLTRQLIVQHMCSLLILPERFVLPADSKPGWSISTRPRTSFPKLHLGATRKAA